MENYLVQVEYGCQSTSYSLVASSEDEAKIKTIAYFKNYFENIGNPKLSDEILITGCFVFNPDMEFRLSYISKFI